MGVIGYRIKREFLEEILRNSEKCKDICTTQEFFEYNNGIPSHQYGAFFIEKNIPFTEPFVADRDRGEEIVIKILAESYLGWK